MNSVVMLVCDSGSSVFQKNCKGLVLLMCEVFSSFLGMVMKNCWNSSVLVVDVISGRISLVQLLSIFRLVIILQVGQMCILIGSISVMKMIQNVVLWNGKWKYIMVQVDRIEMKILLSVMLIVEMNEFSSICLIGL